MENPEITPEALAALSHKKDQKLAGRLLDLLMPDLVDELTLEIFRRAHADKPQPPIVAWPEELLAA